MDGSKRLSVIPLDLAWSRPSRAERTIACSRLALAAFALGAVWLDPTEPVRHAGTAYLLLTAYLGYALTLVVQRSMSAVLSPRLAFIAHGIDLAFAIAINYFTGSDSPFFVLFVFLLFAATLRWHYRGTAWTAAVALLAFVVLGIVGPGGIADPGFELNRFLMRSGYLVVTAGLLGSLGDHVSRLRHDLGSLAAGPARPMSSAEQTISPALAHVATILGHARIVLVLEQPDEPWVEMIWWDNDAQRRERLGPEQVLPLVHDDLDRAAFLCAELAADPANVVRYRGGEFVRWSGRPLHPGLERRFATCSVLAFPVIGESTSGRIFVLDKRNVSADDLVVGTILGQQVAALIDAGVLADELQRSAAATERVRLARELHDGITQAITGTALQLSSVRRLILRDPERAIRHLDQIQAALLDEHRELRLFIQELRPAATLTPARGIDKRLAELSRQIGILWSIDVDAQCIGEVPAAYVDDVYRIVHEGAVNAARHSGASALSVLVAASTAETRIAIRDQGQGFPFRGTYALPELVSQRLGPNSLKERVQSLSGSMAIQSDEHGASVEIVVPHLRRIA